ncbi:MAG: MFS transporter [Hyphomicrobiaceae bacterium]
MKPPRDRTGVAGQGGKRCGLREIEARVIVAIMAFLTVADLFAAQAILPALATHYAATPAEMGVAVNSCTLGMALAGLAVGVLGHRIDRRKGTALSLALLSIPTLLLAVAPTLEVFASLRVAQGLLMSTAFSLTIGHLSERASHGNATGYVAAYITGNVASNLFGRLLASSLVEGWGLAHSFAVFAILNLFGAALAWHALRARSGSRAASSVDMSMVAAWRKHIANPVLQKMFAVGFLILFVFVGLFSYVSFVLIAPPLSLSAMRIGLVYFVFLPSILVTPLAAHLVAQLGASKVLLSGFALALIAMPLVLSGSLGVVLIGLALAGVGLFLAQAVATGLVGLSAAVDPGSASGLYLAAYFLGGLIGSAAVGAVFVHAGWLASIAVLTAALALACRLALSLSSHAGR